MKFVVEHLSSSGARAGRLSGLRSQPDHVYETPLCLISTKGGSVPHLTQDVVHMVTSKEAILSHSAQHFNQQTKTLQAFKKGVNSFAGLPSHGSHLSIQDSSKETPQGYNDKKGVSVWSYSGRQQLNADRYMEVVSAVKPDWFEALNDADTNAESSKKRIFKSIEASTNLLQQCQDLRKQQTELSSIPMFAPLLGGYNIEDRKRWSQEIAEKTYVDGYILLGLHTNGEPVQNISGADITKLVKASTNPLPSSSPRSAPGAWNPLTVIMLAELGIDIFDSSFPFCVTERGAALVFPNKIGQEDIEHKNKKLKSEPVIDDKENISEVTPYEISLKDKRLFASKDPIFSGCECHTCQNFSRSYIHHLLNTKELLSSVLLMIHNLHHWLLFFKTLRKASLNDQLDQLRDSITSSIHRND